MRLELRGITKRFGEVLANDHIDLTVVPGEIHALLGENGAGKSTPIRRLCGRLKPTGGRAIVAGHDVAREPTRVKASAACSGPFSSRAGRC